jgi:DNA polymerase I-like protein with 3'-5' exonuclease and polymerase domains
MVYRKMFIAPPDGYKPSPGFFRIGDSLVGPPDDDDDEWFAIEADLSQAELRIAASMSGDKTMIEIYRTGGDIHKATALIVAGVTLAEFEALPKKEQKELRQKAKAVNFGFLYGMGWRKFIGYAKTQYNVEFTEKEAQRIRTGFFAKYKALARWHDVMRNFATEHKMVRSYTGRIRHLPMIDSPEEFIQQEAGRQAINSPVQETGSSLGVMALGRINEEIDPHYMQTVGFIHDAIVVYVRKKHLTWGMRTLKHYMQTNPLQEWFGTEIKVPIVADVGFGLNLGEIHECEGFSLDKPFDYTSLKDKDGNLLIEVPRQHTPRMAAGLPALRTPR